MDTDFIIELDWSEADTTNATRVGAMYCFKYCDIHWN